MDKYNIKSENHLYTFYGWYWAFGELTNGQYFFYNGAADLLFIFNTKMDDIIIKLFDAKDNEKDKIWDEELTPNIIHEYNYFTETGKDFRSKIIKFID